MAASASFIFWSASASSSELGSICLAFLVFEGGALTGVYSSGLTCLTGDYSSGLTCLTVSSFGFVSGWFSVVLGIFFGESDYFGWAGVSVG